MSFALRLKELREKKGFSQAQLASKLNVGIGSVGMWESTQRTPPAKRLNQIADFFGVSVDYLLGREEKITPDENINSAMSSSDETRLLEIYRTLSPDMRSTLWSLLETWCPSSTRKNKV